jgi:hypothetical protein
MLQYHTNDFCPLISFHFEQHLSFHTETELLHFLSFHKCTRPKYFFTSFILIKNTYHLYFIGHALIIEMIAYYQIILWFNFLFTHFISPYYFYYSLIISWMRILLLYASLPLAIISGWLISFIRWYILINMAFIILTTILNILITKYYHTTFIINALFHKGRPYSWHNWRHLITR